MKNYKSIAVWPEGTCTDQHGRSQSVDYHHSRADAEATCNMLVEMGFGGDGKIFPICTRVEPVISALVCNDGFRPREQSKQPDTEININYLGDMRKVSLKPGDTLVLQTEVNLSDVQYAGLVNQIKKQFPDNKCIVLEGGMKLGVVENAK